MKKHSLWLLPFYMSVATYCYYEKVRRTMWNVIVSYLLNESYNKEQRIESIILWRSNFFTEMISFPAYSAVRLYWIGLESFISCWQNRRKKINKCIIQVLAHIDRYIWLKSTSEKIMIIIIVIISKTNYISK